MRYAVIDRVTGEILNIKICDVLDESLFEGTSRRASEVDDDVQDDTHRFVGDDPNPVLLDPLPLPDTMTVIAGVPFDFPVPDDTLVALGITNLEVVDDKLTISDQEGSMVVRVNPPFPFLDKNIVVNVVSPDEYYELDGVVVSRPSVTIPADFSIIGDDEDFLVISDIPTGTTVRVISTTTREYVVDDGSFEWGSTRPGVYGFEIEPPFPYCNSYFTVTVHAS